MAGRLTLERGTGEAAGIATLRIDNPAKYNAMSLAMWQELATQVRALGEDRSVRVLVLRGEGDKAFVSGADISEFDKTRSAETGSELYDFAVEDAQAALAEAPFPVVALIHGICMGGGLGLALACDLRYCATTTKFRMPAARLGLGYAFNGIRQMVAALGGARVADLFFTARTFDGAEGERIGLVHSVFPPDALDAEVAALVTAIAGKAPLTQQLIKAAIRWSQFPSTMQDDAAAMAVMRQRCVQSADYAEGRKAFAEKRPPRFVGA